jgi:hypothetical protein
MFKKFMKRIFFKMTRRATLFATVAAILSLSMLSCSDVYDNIRDFSMKEVVYPAHFDTIHARPGYERVEIDLSKEGRLPAYMMYLGKGKKTILEYDTVHKEFDSICSWINVTGLTLPKLYRFRVYTADEYENRSTPMEIALTPYTSVDKEALGVPNPETLSLSGFVAIRWLNGLSSDILDYISMSYSYTDKDGRLRKENTEGNILFVNNIKNDEEVIVDVRYVVYPKLGGERILDTVSFVQQIPVRLSADSEPIEFDVSPKRIALLPGKMKVAVPNIEFGLSWESSNPAVASVNANGVISARTPGTAVITVKTIAIENALATVTVTVPDVSSVPAGDKLAGMWSFEDNNDLVKASVGLDLEPFGKNFTPIAGPGNSGGVQFGAGSYYALLYEMAASGGGKNVNEYTLMMDIKVPSSSFSAWKSVFNTWPDNVGEGVIWTATGDLGKEALGEGWLGKPVLTADTWHRVVFTAQLDNNKRSDAFRVYVDGVFHWEATANIGLDGMLSLYTDAMYIGCDNMGNGKLAPDCADLRLWSVRLTDAQIKTLGKPGQ